MQPEQEFQNKQNEELINRIIYPKLEDNIDDEQFVLIQCEVQPQPLTQFLVQDKSLYDVQVKVIDYVYQKTYMVLSTETFIIKIHRKNGDYTIQQSRNLSDFYWLRNTLIIKYPGIGIPTFMIQGSIHNLAKQKIMVAQQFLIFLSSHSVLRYSAEVVAFLSDKISYLETRKQIQINTKTSKGYYGNFEIRNIVQVIKSWKKSSNQVLPLKIPNLKQVIQQEAYFKNTLNEIHKLIQFSRKNQSLTKHVMETQIRIFQKHFINEECRQIEKQLKELFKQNMQIKNNQQSLQYLQFGIKMKIVKENFTSYLEWFDKIKNLSQSIIARKSNNQYELAYSEEKYLKLLLNNMIRDMKIWIQYNDNLIETTLSQL